MSCSLKYGELAESAVSTGRSRAIALHDLDREVAVGDADVDLQAADQLLVDEHPVLLLHAAVAPGRR